jgi:glycosyltransferase involved in cell wall biosynthesis
LGRLTKIKRIDRLIEVIKIIHSKNLSVRFLIAGGGEEVVLLQKATEEHNLPVKILGWVTDIASLLSVSDVLILTSDNEGTPISIIQAGLMGVPVVATNVGSVEELVLDGKTGFICDKTSASLADKIMIMAENSELRKEMGAAAKMFMENSFSLSTFLENHKNMYVDVLNN